MDTVVDTDTVLVTMADTDMVMVSDMEVMAMLTIMARDPLKLSPKLMLDICMEVMDMADMVVMDTDVDTDTVLDTDVDTDTVSMVLATVAMPESTITARDPLKPSPKLMPDICTEVMDMVAMDTDVDTDTVLVTMVDTDMVVVFTDTDGDVKHSQVQLSIFL